MNSDKRIYWILCVLSLSGYAWIGFNAWHIHHTENISLCLFKNITGIPCPSCGITRSILLLAHGDITGALLLNPLGLLAAVLLLTIPIWIIRDGVNKKKSLLIFYKLAEKKLHDRKILYLPLIVLLLLNWFWNITKQL